MKGLLLLTVIIKTVLLDQLGPWISKEIDIPVSLADEPLLCVVKGIGIVLDNLELYRHVLKEA
jgi:rod shape-determining protein MreB